MRGAAVILSHPVSAELARTLVRCVHKNQSHASELSFGSRSSRRTKLRSVARMRFIIGILLVAAMSSGAARAGDTELELELYRERHRGPQQPIAPTAQPSLETQACFERLTVIAYFVSAATPTEPTKCAVTGLVRLEHVKMSDQTKVAIVPPAILRCEMAESFAQWIRDDVGPAAAKSIGQIRAFSGVGSFECRGRNGIASAKPSEHAKANAIDVGTISFQKDKLIKLTDPTVPRPFREKIRTRACDRFTTVLGPGSDAYHNDHIHLDLAERTGGYRICQWNVSETLVSALIPLPRPRPRNLNAGR